jgi:ELWxxDGT repeat protein
MNFVLSGTLNGPFTAGSFVSSDVPYSLKQFSNVTITQPLWERGLKDVSSFSLVGGRMFFFDLWPTSPATSEFTTAYEGTLYRSDLTEEGTVNLGTFGLRGTFSGPQTLAGKVGNKFLFAAKDATAWSWFSAGAVKLDMRRLDLYPKIEQSSLPALGNRVLLQSVNGGAGSFWLTDGTAEGTKNTDLNLFNFDHSFSFNDVPYFLNKANDGSNQTALWRTDGTKSGTALVKNLSCTNLKNSFFVERLSSFMFLCGGDQLELWLSNGTSRGTALLKVLEITGVQQSAMYVIGDYAFITVEGNDSGHFSLWRSDGSRAGTTLIKRWDGERLYYGTAAAMGSHLYFTLWNAARGSYEIWKSDGSTDGTKLALDVPQGTFSKIGQEIVSNGDTLVFTADDGVVGNEPWAITSKVIDDQCPDDIRKIRAGVCGCGRTELDSDSDGVVDCKEIAGGNSQLTPTPSPQPTVGGQADPKIAGMRVPPPVIRQKRNSVVVTMQTMSGVSYKISFTVQSSGRSKQKKVRTKVLTVTKPQVVLGKFKAGTILAVSYKMVAATQESLSSRVVRFKVKLVKRGYK